MTRRMQLRAPAVLHSPKTSTQVYAMLQAAVDNLRSFGGPATAVQLANRLRGTGLSVDFRVFERALRFGVELEELAVVEGTRQHKVGGHGAPCRLEMAHVGACLPPIRRRAYIAAALVALALAGCTGGYEVEETWVQGGCARAAHGIDVVEVCGVGQSRVYHGSELDTPPSFGCSAEWRHNGTVVYHSTAACVPGADHSEVHPTLLGVSSIRWTLDGDYSRVQCVLRVPATGGQELEVAHRCAGVVYNAGDY